MTPETPHLRSARAVAAWLRACLSDAGAEIESVTEGEITIRAGHHRAVWILRFSGWYADSIDPSIIAAFGADWRTVHRLVNPVKPPPPRSPPEPPIEWPTRPRPGAPMDPLHLPEYPPLAVALLAQSLALTPRATALHTGDPESVTDHTVALGWLAVAVCPARMDPAKVALFATVHDLLEAVTGDTNTLTATPAERAAKDAAETAALLALRGRIPHPLLSAVADYEEQTVPEARFVKVLDKTVPKLCHLLNMRHLAAMMPRAELAAFLANQSARLRADYPDQPEALALFDETSTILLGAYPA